MACELMSARQPDIQSATYFFWRAPWFTDPPPPKLWSEKRLADFGINGAASYDVAPDGKRIVALMPAETPPSQQVQHHVIFLENFFGEFRRRVPT